MAKRITGDKIKKSPTSKVKAPKFSAAPTTAKVVAVRAVKSTGSPSNQGGSGAKTPETSTPSTADNIKHRVTQLQLQLDNHALQQAAQRQIQEVTRQRQQLACARAIVAQHEDYVPSHKFARKTLREIREVTENYVTQFEEQMLAGLEAQRDPALVNTFLQETCDWGQQEFNDTLYSLYDEQGRNPNYMGGYVLPTTTKKRLRGDTQVFATQRQIQNPVYHYNTQAALVSDPQAYHTMCGQLEQGGNLQYQPQSAIAQVPQFERPAYGSTVGINGHQQNHQLTALANLPLLQANHEVAVNWLLETGFMGSEQQAMQALQQRHEFQEREQQLILECLTLPSSNPNHAVQENKQVGNSTVVSLTTANNPPLSASENAQEFSSEVYVPQVGSALAPVGSGQHAVLADKNSLSASISNLKQRVLNSLETTQSQTSTTENKVVTKPSKGYQVLSHTQSLTQTRTIKQIIQLDGTVLSQVIDTNVTVESATNTLDSGELETQSTRTIEKKVTHNQQDIETILERRALLAELNQYGAQYASQFAPYGYNQYAARAGQAPSSGWLGLGTGAGQVANTTSATYPTATTSTSTHYPETPAPYLSRQGIATPLMPRLVLHDAHAENLDSNARGVHVGNATYPVARTAQGISDVSRASSQYPVLSTTNHYPVVASGAAPCIATQQDVYGEHACPVTENITLSVNPEGVWVAESSNYSAAFTASQSLPTSQLQEDEELEAYLEKNEMFDSE